MAEFLNTLYTTLRSRKKLLYFSLATSFLLLCFFWSPQIRTSTRTLLPVFGISHEHTSTDILVAETQTPPYTAAIIYIVRISDIPQLLDSLSSVHKNTTTHPWPIILFHTGEFDHDSIRMDFIGHLWDYIGERNGSVAFAERLEFVRLDGLDEVSEDVEDAAYVEHRWLDYHHYVSSFFTREIFSHPRLMNITYYMRMDPVSLFTSPPLCNDPFEVMYTHQRLYGYLSTGSDLPEYTVGLWPFVRNFSRAHSAVERQLRVNNWEWEDELPGGEGETVGFRGYDTNFEIVKLDAFRRPDVKEWLEAISKYPEGIFKLEWGDAQLRYATVHMFFDDKKDTERLCGIGYSR